MRGNERDIVPFDCCLTWEPMTANADRGLKEFDGRLMRPSRFPTPFTHCPFRFYVCTNVNITFWKFNEKKRFRSEYFTVVLMILPAKLVYPMRVW